VGGCAVPNSHRPDRWRGAPADHFAGYSAPHIPWSGLGQAHLTVLPLSVWFSSLIFHSDFFFYFGGFYSGILYLAGFQDLKNNNFQKSSKF
jgi:hypothetical protein